MSAKTPTSTDAIVGQNVRRCRMSAGMSQEKLGEAIGVTFQQVQKYENGKNRMSPGRIIDVCKVLGVKVADIIPEPDVPPSALAMFSNDALKGAAIIDTMPPADRIVAVRVLRAVVPILVAKAEAHE
jgi:transcriptional regulator with XRE-family HTH domain